MGVAIILGNLTWCWDERKYMKKEIRILSNGLGGLYRFIEDLNGELDLAGYGSGSGVKSDKSEVKDKVEEGMVKMYVRSDTVAYTDRCEVVVDVPGYTSKDIEVEIEKDSLVITGKKDIEVAEGVKMMGSDRYSGNYFKKVFDFTDKEVYNLSGIKAEVKDGVLKVVVPFAEKKAVEGIKIKVG